MASARAHLPAPERTAFAVLATLSLCHLFNDLLRALLTFVFPVAFATTFPTEALRGHADLRLLPVGFVLATALLFGAHLFWNYAVRHYSSASS